MKHDRTQTYAMDPQWWWVAFAELLPCIEPGCFIGHCKTTFRIIFSSTFRRIHGDNHIPNRKASSHGWLIALDTGFTHLGPHNQKCPGRILNGDQTQTSAWVYLRYWLIWMGFPLGERPFKVWHWESFLLSVQGNNKNRWSQRMKLPAWVSVKCTAQIRREILWEISRYEYNSLRECMCISWTFLY